MTTYHLMQVKSIAEYFPPSLSYRLSLRSLFMSIFEWPFFTGFTVELLKALLLHQFICANLFEGIVK